MLCPKPQGKCLPKSTLTHPHVRYGCSASMFQNTVFDLLRKLKKKLSKEEKTEEERCSISLSRSYHKRPTWWRWPGNKKHMSTIEPFPATHAPKQMTIQLSYCCAFRSASACKVGPSSFLLYVLELQFHRQWILKTTRETPIPPLSWVRELQAFIL